MTQDIINVRKEKAPSKKKMPKFSWKNLLIALLLIGFAGAAVYFYMDAQDAKSNTPEGVQARNVEESARVVKSLEKILLLDPDQQPTVARVEDPDVLREANADFYRDTAVNDYLILYPQRAIIYREADNLIVNIAPIINTAGIQPQTDEPTDSTSEQQ